MRNYLVLNSLLSRLEKGTRNIEVIIPALHPKTGRVREYIANNLDIELPIDIKTEVDVYGVQFTIYDDFYTEKDLSKYQYTDVNETYKEDNVDHRIEYRIYFREIN